MGPVQVLVIGFDEPSFSGEVLGELARLREAGIVRLVDLLLVERAEDGTFETVDEVAAASLGLGELAAALVARTDNGNGDSGADALADTGAWSLADVVPAGSVAAVALLEHTWAVPLTTAIANAGGTPLEETWLAQPERDALEGLLSQSPPQ